MGEANMSGFVGAITDSTCREILDSISEALIFADNDGVIRVWNSGAEFVFGFASEEALGKTLDLIIPEKLRKAHWTGFQRAVEQGKTVSGRGSAVTRAVNKSGDQLYVDMSFAIVKNRAGETIGSTAIARNATLRFLEEKELRKQLAEFKKNV